MRRIEPPAGWIPPDGLCECGCGAKTPIAPATRQRAGVYVGYPTRFIRSHGARTGTGPSKYELKSKRQRTKLPIATCPAEVVASKPWLGNTGYRLVYTTNHPAVLKNATLTEHRLIMERHLGRFLEPQERIHHRNGNRIDNHIDNLELWKRKGHPDGIRATDYHCSGCRCFDH